MLDAKALSVETRYLLNGQEHKQTHKIDKLSLRNGKEIPASLLTLEAGRIDINASDQSEAPLRALVRLGCPLILTAGF